MKNHTFPVVIIVVALLVIIAAVFRIHTMSLSAVSTETVSTSATPLVSSTPPVIAVTYICAANKTIDASFYNIPDATSTVALTLSDGRFMTLPQAISADGARYATADESFVFWSKGDGALVFENGEEKNYTGCVAATR